MAWLGCRKTERRYATNALCPNSYTHKENTLNAATRAMDSRLWKTLHECCSKAVRSEKITAPLWTLVDICVFQTKTKVYAQTYTDAEHTAQSRAFMLGVTLQGD